MSSEIDAGIDINNPLMVERLFVRLGMILGQDESMLLSRLLHPVVDIGDLLRTPKGFDSTFDNTSATKQAVHTVPAGKRWFLRNLVVRNSQATIYDPAWNPGGLGVWYDLDVDQTTASRWGGQGFLLYGGDVLGVNVTSAGVGTGRMEIVVDEEDVG